MFGWFYFAVERWARATPRRLDKLCEHIPLWFVRKLSEAKLIRTLRHVYRNSQAQRRRWNQGGIKLSDIRSADVLQKLPFTTGEQIAEHPENYFCAAADEFIYVISTSCTKGLSKKIYLTADDYQRQVRMIGTHLRRFPGAERVAALFVVHDPTWTVGAVISRSVAEAGMLGFLCGVHRSAKEQIDLIKEYQINRLVTTPAYLSRLTYESPEEVGNLGIRYIHLGAQSWTQEFRAQMEKAWKAKLIDGYGTNECVCGIASECIHQNGLHVAEVDYWVEIVDPDTGKVLPEGQEGEVVITTLSRRGMPLVRYRSGDLACLLADTDRCECGLPLRKMSRVRGRLDDMLIIGAGDNLYSEQVDKAVLSIRGITDYQMVICKDSYKDVISLTVESNGSLDNLRQVLPKALLSIASINSACELSQTLRLGEIQIVSPGTLGKGRPKSNRIIDKRPKPTAVKAAPAAD